MEDVLTERSSLYPSFIDQSDEPNNLVGCPGQAVSKQLSSRLFDPCARGGEEVRVMQSAGEKEDRVAIHLIAHPAQQPSEKYESSAIETTDEVRGGDGRRLLLRVRRDQIEQNVERLRNALGVLDEAAYASVVTERVGARYEDGSVQSTGGQLEGEIEPIEHLAARLVCDSEHRDRRQGPPGSESAVCIDSIPR
jgi:hypothetical protein